jgi:hypothetical protein
MCKGVKMTDICKKIFLVMTFATLPIVNLVYVVKYKNQIECNVVNETSLEKNINSATWLSVQSIFILSIIVIMLFFELIFNARLKQNTCVIWTKIVFFSLLGLFQTAWLIVGAVMFWRDCIDVSPNSIRILMWFNLIYGLIQSSGLSIFSGYSSGRNRNRSSFRGQSPY